MRKVLAPSWIVIGGLALLIEVVIAGHAVAQQPAAPDPGTWIGSAGAGLALTSGNSDTLNFNVAFDVTRDPKTRNIMKWTGLYLDTFKSRPPTAATRKNDVALVTAITTKF